MSVHFQLDQKPKSHGYHKGEIEFLKISVFILI
jgi:hypothetical protein